jgi:hypothetical protein
MFHWSKFTVKTELFSVGLSKYYFAQEENAWDEAALSEHNDYVFVQMFQSHTQQQNFHYKAACRGEEIPQKFQTYLL